MNKRFAGILLAVVCLLVFCGAVSLEPEEVYIGSFSGQCKYLRSSGGRVYAAMGNTVFSFDSEGGNVASVTCSGRVKACHVAGSSAYFITDNGASLGFEEHSLYGGILNSQSNIIDPSLYGYVTAMTIDDNGNVWLAVKNKELWFCNTSTGKSSLACKFDKAISSLHWVDSQLCAVSGSRVYFCEGQETVDASSYAELFSKPLRFYSDSLYVDSSGRFCSGSSLLFGTVTVDAGAITHYTDGNYAWYLTEERVAVKADLYGNILAQYRTDGLICGVCDLGLLTAHQGELYFAPYASAPEPTPTPEPTKTPAVKDESSEEVLPDLPDENEYLVVQAGSTVTDVTGKMNCQLWNEKEKVTSGLVRTGMMAKSGSREMVIVIPGDANGTGTVNSADFRAIQEHLLETEKLSGAYYLAADVSGNGKVGTEDLVLILKKFE